MTKKEKLSCVVSWAATYKEVHKNNFIYRLSVYKAIISLMRDIKL